MGLVDFKRREGSRAACGVRQKKPQKTYVSLRQWTKAVKLLHANRMKNVENLGLHLQTGAVRR